jgi:hypothetical protein
LVLCVAAALEALSAINDVPILFADDPEVPGPGLAGALITAKIALTPLLAFCALVFAASNRLRAALLSMAAIIALTWLSYLPSVAIHGLELQGSAAVVLYTLFQIVVIPLVLATIVILALRGDRPRLATALAVLPALVSVLGVAAFAIGVAMYGF